MENIDIFLTLKEVVKKSISNIEKWDKALLYIKKMKGNTGFESSYIYDGNEVKIDTTANYLTHKAVTKLYDITQNEFPKHKDWNRAIFTLFPNNKFEMEYIWDEELQQEVDGYNNSSTT